MLRLLLVLTCLVWPLSAFGEEQGTLTVTGVGEVSVAPDMARITLGVQHQADAADAALAAVSTDLSALLATLSDMGIADADRQTTSLRLDVIRDYPQNGPPRVTGYRASSDVQVTVRELDLLGEILDAIVADGANRFSGLQFDVSDRARHLNAARVAAVLDASDRATVLAEAAGVTLGPIRSLTEGSPAMGPVPMMEMRSMADSGVPVAEGEITLSATVTIRYGID